MSRNPRLSLCIAASFALLTACNGGSNASSAAAKATPAAAGADADAVADAPGQAVAMDAGNPFAATALATFDEPWAMSFLPDGRLLVSEKAGALKLFDFASGKAGDIAGVPEVEYGG